LLSVWISLFADFSMSARLGGPLAAAILGVGFVLARRKRARFDEPESRFAARRCTAALRGVGRGGADAAELGWATLDTTERTLPGWCSIAPCC